MAFTPKLLQQGASGASGYQISRSLRFNSADSAYLSRTPSSAGNRKTFTVSYWAKRGTLGVTQYLFAADSGTTESTWFQVGAFDNNGTSYDSTGLGTWTTSGGQTPAIYRDTSAWYHFVWAVDTTQATASNRVKLWVNGVQQTLSTIGITQNADLAWNNSGVVHYIGARIDAGPRQFFDGYLTEIYNIDGQALTPSSFGETNAQTGVWRPKKYSGSYGTNGFYLNFSDNSNTTAATLGKDYSGNGNNFTPNNFSVSAGAGNDSLVDTPTLYGTDTGAGGSVRGNYCTFSAVDKATTVTLSNGGLDLIGTNAGGRARASMAVSSGKWYFEFLMVAIDGGGYNGFMATTARADVTGGGGTTDLGVNADTWGVPNGFNGQVRNNGTNGGSITGITNGQIGMFALDMDSGKFWYGINGTWVNSGDPATGANPVYSNLSGYTIAAAIGHGVNTSISYSYNFGQRAFSYTAPTGFKALCTQNLPTPTIAQGNKYMDASIYTGNGTSQSLTLGFQPDFTWFKARNIGYSSILTNSVTGGSNYLVTSSTATEQGGQSLVTSWTSTGVNIGSWIAVNESTITYVAWSWKAGGTAVTNTTGSITSSVSANPTSGFSVVTYTGVTNGTVGHGLGVAPHMIIVKSRAGAQNWFIYHISNGATKYMTFSTDSSTTSSGAWNDTAPTSSVFTTGSFFSTNTMLAYCFAPVAGFSAFGSYIGNGSTDGPFVYTGFKPRFVMIKDATTASTQWTMLDSARNNYNVVDARLIANLSNSENAQNFLDFTSNGFKLRDTYSVINQSGATLIYMAFAESPFKYALAR